MAKPYTWKDDGARKAREEHVRRVAAVPSLHLLVWPSMDGMRLSLVIYHSSPGIRRTCTVLRDAIWQPKEVSEKALVEWGRRAPSDWLEKGGGTGEMTQGPWPM